MTPGISPPPEFVEFKIFVDEHQTVELPTGTLIDMGFSGRINPENDVAFFDGAKKRVVLLFNNEGLPDRYIIGEQGLKIAGTTSFLVRSYKDYADPPATSPVDSAKNVLSNPDAYWVSTNSQTGRTFFGKTRTNVTSETVLGVVRESRGGFGQ